MELDRIDRLAAGALDGYLVRKDLVDDDLEQLLASFCQHFSIISYLN